MDAVEFLKERRRMCNAQDGCSTCPINIACEDYFVNCKYTRENTEDMISKVEKWSKEHPVKTRQSEFLKMFPDARTDLNGSIELCPKRLVPSHQGDCKGCRCNECRKKFWSQEVE